MINKKFDFNNKNIFFNKYYNTIYGYIYKIM